MNSLLIESEYFVHENCLLPKSLFVCILRVVEQEGIARGSKELQHLEQEEEHIVPKGAREEREACARGKDEGEEAREEEEPNRHASRPMPAAMPAGLPSKPAPRPA